MRTYKKPSQKNFGNGKSKVYKPKKAVGGIRGRSQEKIEQNLIKNIDVNDNLNYALTSMNQKKVNGNNYCKSPNITYNKKRFY